MGGRGGASAVVAAAILLLAMPAAPMLAAPMQLAEPEAHGQTSPPYHRFWRGHKLSNITREGFLPIIHKFIADTTDLGEGVALVSYVPALSMGEPTMPFTEAALVSYESKQAYDTLMTSPKGVAYQESHWGLFNASLSSSKVPTPFGDAGVRIGEATDVMNGTALFYTAAAAFECARRGAGVSDAAYEAGVNEYIRGVRFMPAAEGRLLSWLVRVDADAVFEYSLWASKDAMVQVLGSAAGKAARKRREEVTTEYERLASPVESTSHQLAYGASESIKLPPLP